MSTPRLRAVPARLPVLDIRSARPAPKRADPFYLSREWRELVRRLIAKRGRRCEAKGCGRSDCRIFGDHIVELADGGEELDEANVMLLCGSCHTGKTASRRADRVAGRPTYRR